MKIKKAVFPVAGLGTRFLPATKANPKEMMPVVDKPLIQYAVEEAILAGVEDLIFVTSSSKRAIEDHFDTHFELEAKLLEREEHRLLDLVRNIIPPEVNCIYIRQAEAKGLGHAILCAHHIVGNEPFAVLLADDLIDAETHPSCLAQMIEHFSETQGNILAVEKIPLEDSYRYGMVGFDKEQAQPLRKINRIIEKPSHLESPSAFAVVGRYILHPAIFQALKHGKADAKGELQLTDAIAKLVPENNVYALEFTGKRYDCGNKLGYLQAIVSFGLKHPEVQKEFQTYLAELQ